MTHIPDEVRKTPWDHGFVFVHEATLAFQEGLKSCRSCPAASNLPGSPSLATGHRYVEEIDFGEEQSQSFGNMGCLIVYSPLLTLDYITLAYLIKDCTSPCNQALRQFLSLHGGGFGRGSTHKERRGGQTCILPSFWTEGGWHHFNKMRPNRPRLSRKESVIS